MNFTTAVFRALALKCPVCGKGKLAKGWLSTNEQCSSCGTDFAGEAGYYLGAIYFNYGVTVLVSLSIAIPSLFIAKFPAFPVVASLAVLCVLFPLWFFRYARSLWLSFDHYYDSRKKELASQQIAIARELNRVPVGTARDKVMGCICQLCHHRFSVPIQLSRKWSKCPACYGDVLLMPVTPNLEPNKDTRDRRVESSPSQREAAVHV